MRRLIRFQSSKAHRLFALTSRISMRKLKIGMLFAALLQLGCSQQQFGIASQNQTFGQKVTYTKTLDVLWVVDNSGSMATSDIALGAQASSFVHALDQTGLDYQMAVTTMDMSNTGEDGRFIAAPGTPLILNTGIPNIASILQNRINIGYSGSSLSRGLLAMQTALSAPLSTVGANAGFLRPNSLLVVVFLTDGNDIYSPNIDYGKYLDSIRPPLASGARSWVAEYMGVVATDPLCSTNNWGFSNVGTRYITLASQSGGSAQSICGGDLKSALSDLQERVLSVLTAWNLDQSPVVSTIVVKVNGALVQQDSVNGWTYDAQSNSVRFHGTAIPAAGSSIQVTFNPASTGGS